MAVFESDIPALGQVIFYMGGKMIIGLSIFFETTRNLSEIILGNLCGSGGKGSKLADDAIGNQNPI